LNAELIPKEALHMPVSLSQHRAATMGTWVLLAWVLVLLASPVVGMSPAMTKENVQKKAVIISQSATLFTKSSGTDGKKVNFMQIFFLLEGEVGGRVPVTIAPGKEVLDGWLARDSYVEWNSLQMIDFEPQSGRELVRIFAEAGCAEQFGRAASPGACEVLGSEPQRSGKQRDDYRLLIPVMERQGENYRGGFVRVGDSGRVVKPQTDLEAGGSRKQSSGRLGYDLVLVVDSTASMQEWFRPTTQALEEFISSVKQRTGSGELKSPFRAGLLFYRDRKIGTECKIEYLFRWGAELTEDIAAVGRSLSSAEEEKCGSDEAPEAVYDALNRAVQDPKWNDGHLKVVILVGDAPPHEPGNKEKNPLGLDVASVTKLSEERNIRLMSFKIGLADEAEFKALALSVKDKVQGRFRAIEPGNQAAYKKALLSALNEEWELLMAANEAVDKQITKEDALKDPSVFEQKGIDVDSYDIPIIIANLPPGSTGSGAPEFVQGWVPKKIKQQLAMGEYVFMNKSALTRFCNVIENVALAAQDGRTEGGDAFISSLRNSLATMLSMQEDQVFRSGESLNSMMQKAELLPFKTTVLSFTAEEVNAWKPADYERLNKVLSEKTIALREFAQKPSNSRMFGDKPHIYVPRDLFP
jgi:hypothetical protein